MENIFDRLQFVKHEEVFATREGAYDYVLGKQMVERPALLAEPMILLYESGDATKGPNVILAVGSVGNGTASQANRTFFIDTQRTEEEIEELREELEEAIKSLTLIPLDSDTLDISAEKTADGTFISGDVKIADYRILSGKVNENIIQTEGTKGIYAFVDMDYDPETFIITFNVNGVTKEFQLPPDQHVVKGWYNPKEESIFLKLADDSEVKILVTKLIEEWTVLPDGQTLNDYNVSGTVVNYSPIVLYRTHVGSKETEHEGIYEWQDVLEADIRVADHISDNIIHKDRTGRYLYVKGTADNILYKDGKTVKDALDNMDCKVSTSTGNLIYKRPDGLYAYAMLDYNTAENKLVYTYSDGNTSDIKTLEFKLNSVKILEDITYDPVREMIVIRYIDAQGEYQKVEIPVADIIEEWDVNNEGHSIKLDKYRNERAGKDILTADAKIHVGDNNILEDLNHELYVNGISDNIKYDVTGDTTVKDVLDNLSTSAETLNNKIDQEIADRTAAVERIDNTIGSGFTADPHENITYKFEELSDKLDSEIERSTTKDEELETALNNEIERSTTKDEELEAAIAAETARAEAAETVLTDKIGTGFTDDPHDNVTYKFEQLQNQVNEEADKLQNEIDRSTAKDDEHDARLDAIDAEIGSGFDPRNTVRDEINKLQDEIDDVSADTLSRLTDVINEDHSINVETRNDGNDQPTIKVVSVNLSEEIEDNKPNIIKLNADGLYAGVDLIYEFDEQTGSNQLIFKTTTGTKVYDLKTNSVVDKIYYDPTREAIIIEYTVNGHRMPDVVIPVGDLINEWRVEDGHPHAVQLEKVRESGATQDVLKASVVITDDHDDNILVMDDGALYVSGAQIAQNKADIAAEIERAMAAENDLEDALDAEIARATSADTQLANDILAEKSRAEIADAALENAIEMETLRAKTAEEVLSGNIATVQTNLQNEIDRATAAEGALETALNNEITRSTTKDQELTDAINAENVRATSAETALQTAINNEVTRATTVENTLSGSVSNVQSSLQDEVTRATNAETALQTALNNEITRSTEKDTELASAISDERVRATSAETALQTAIDNEVTRATTAENTLSGNVSDIQTALQNEINRATNAESALTTALNSEISRSTQADADLLDAIQAEETRATLADADLLDKIEDEITARESGDTMLSHLIDDEANRRINADSTIASNLNTEIARATGEEARLETALNSEVSRAQSAETALNDAITTETLRAQEADNELYQKIADERAERISGDTTILSKVEQETTRATAKEEIISGLVVNEIARSTAEDTRLSDALTAETAARQQADSDLHDEIVAATLTFDDTSSIDFTKTTGNVVTADVKLQEGDNIIKLGQGLYATATLEYEPTGNKIRLVTSNGAQEYIQLVGATLLDSITYDPVNKLLVISYTDGTGSHRETAVGVTDLWNEWVVDNPSEKSAVKLTKVIGDPGNADTISANVLITDDRDGDGKPDAGSNNIIEIKNNGLYVDGSALSAASETAECVANELNVLERVVIGHQIDNECGSGYTYEPNTMAQYINSAQSFNNADYILDQAIKNVQIDVNTISAKTDCVDDKSDKIYELLYGAGATMPDCGEGATYQPYVGACIISAATSFNEADQMLNDQICQLLTMWVSAATPTNDSTWVEDGANRKLQVDARLSHGNNGTVGMPDESLVITTTEGVQIEPGVTEFTDTNVLRVVHVTEGPGGGTLPPDYPYNGLYVSNEWDCGMYYGVGDDSAKAAAEAAGYNTNYSTDESADASNYNYMNNVRQNDI